MNALWLYRQLWHIAPPLIKRYLKRRAERNPAYAEHWAERFGEPYPNPVRGSVWIHAVSVGETQAAAPLVAALHLHFPDAPLLITQMTPTGRAAAQKQFPQAQCRYLPYDKPEYVAQFLSEHQPRFGILMETEIWPNLIAECGSRNIPLFLANARLSEKSLAGYRKIQPLLRQILPNFSGCFAQSAADAQRLTALGMPNPEICGNTKYDLTPPESATALAADFRARIGKRPIVVCGSTRVYKNRNEAELLLSAWQKQWHGNTLLVIVPRHPERFEETFQTACALGFRTQKRSDNQPVAPETQVWIGDSMGELPAYYALADIAFVGGSLVDSGCQNIIEPLSAGVPTLFGPSTYNFAQVCADALQADAAYQIADADEWAQTVCRWLEQPQECAAAAERAKQFVAAHRGAGKRIADAVAARLAT